MGLGPDSNFDSCASQLQNLYTQNNRSLYCSALVLRLVWIAFNMFGSFKWMIITYLVNSLFSSVFVSSDVLSRSGKFADSIYISTS